MKIGVIILAAGASTRMGSPKQLLPYRGRPLVVHAVEQALASRAAEVLVVVGANAEAVSQALQSHRNVQLLCNADWQQGMGTSIRAGMQAATHLDAVIIALGDQPLVGPARLNSLIATLEQTGKPIVAARYAGVAGVPALFTKTFFPKLLQLPPGAGCKGLIEANPGETTLVDCPEGELDIDTPEDYAKANSHPHAKST